MARENNAIWECGEILHIFYVFYQYDEFEQYGERNLKNP